MILNEFFPDIHHKFHCENLIGRYWRTLEKIMWLAPTYLMCLLNLNVLKHSSKVQFWDKQNLTKLAAHLICKLWQIEGAKVKVYEEDLRSGCGHSHMAVPKDVACIEPFDMISTATSWMVAYYNPPCLQARKEKKVNCKLTWLKKWSLFSGLWEPMKEGQSWCVGSPLAFDKRDFPW